METAKPKIEMIPVGEIVPYENNPRKNEAAIDGVVASIRAYGFRGALLLDRNKVIITGHTRLLAAKRLGIAALPCIVAADLTDEQVRALRIADNKTAEKSTWDMDLLPVELTALRDAGFDMSALGFDADELDEMLSGGEPEEGHTEADDAPESPDDAVSLPGALYALGPHRLLCGDSTDAGQIKRLMGGEMADLWLTDPPYNVDYEGSGGRRIQNDSMPDETFREFLRAAFAGAANCMKPGAVFYIFHADSEGLNFRLACADAGLKVRQCLIWKKNSLVLGRQDYQWIHEPCLTGWKDGSHKWYSDRSQTTVMEFDKPKRNDLHPTMKPVQMLEYLIGNSTARGDLVMDTFGGSGSTLMACQRTGRTCRTMELDPRYCDVIRRRWAEFTHGEGCDWQAHTPQEES